MGVSRLSAIRIQNEGAICTASKPDKETGLFAGYVFAGGERGDLLLSTDPYYNSAEDAKAEMEEVVKQIEELDLSKV